jgi:putative ABC transport system ATP-binding protein
MIEIKKLSKTIKGKRILADISLKLPDSGLFLLRGDNGAGKTTLLEILGLFDRKWEGEMKIDGKDFSKADFLAASAYRKENIAFLLPKGNLIEVETLFENTGLSSEEINRSLGLNLDADVKVGSLSGGEEELIALYLRLKENKKLVFLDEITSALDDVKEEIAMNLIKEASHQSLVLFATHDERTYELGPSIVLEKGRRIC